MWIELPVKFIYADVKERKALNQFMRSAGFDAGEWTVTHVPGRHGNEDKCFIQLAEDTVFEAAHFWG